MLLYLPLNFPYRPADQWLCVNVSDLWQRLIQVLQNLCYFQMRQSYCRIFGHFWTWGLFCMKRRRQRMLFDWLLMLFLLRLMMLDKSLSQRFLSAYVLSQLMIFLQIWCWFMQHLFIVFFLYMKLLDLVVWVILSFGFGCMIVMVRFNMFL